MSLKEVADKSIAVTFHPDGLSWCLIFLQCGTVGLCLEEQRETQVRGRMTEIEAEVEQDVLFNNVPSIVNVATDMLCLKKTLILAKNMLNWGFLCVSNNLNYRDCFQELIRKQVN